MTGDLIPGRLGAAAHRRGWDKGVRIAATKPGSKSPGAPMIERGSYFGRSILHVVASAVDLPSTFASVFHPRLVPSASYLTPFESVET